MLNPELIVLLKQHLDNDLATAAGDDDDSLVTAGLIQIVRNTGYLSGMAITLDWFQQKEIQR